VLAECEVEATIPLRAGAESLNVAAAAAIGCERISSLDMSGERPDA
jgi:tRNA G18 (ribose-2'-O)-methylase SpoU